MPWRSMRRRWGLPLEIGIVWLVFAVVAAEILVTYSRVPAQQLYHVAGSGLEGGASRALVFADFPVALVAIAICGLLVARPPGRGWRAAAIVAATLCATVFWPGVVSEADLDARPVNAAAAGGVLVALILSLSLAPRGGLAAAPWRRFDRVRAVVAAAFLVLALPWLAADLGLFLDGVPVLGRLFQTGSYLPQQPGLPPFPPAVHHGHHHGMDGTLLVICALLLSRLLPTVRRPWLRGALGLYLALMLCYGLGNIANDFWIEQVFKRGWTTWQIPNVLEPRVSVAWGVIVLATLCLWG